MSERSELMSRLILNKKSRADYIKAKLGVLVPSQIRGLRLKSDMPRQSDLAREAEMQQSRISMLETPGAANVTLETLAWLAGVFKTGLVVQFVPFSEMLRWENEFSQDGFNVLRLEADSAFVNPTAEHIVDDVAGPNVRAPSIFDLAAGTRQPTSQKLRHNPTQYQTSPQQDIAMAALMKAAQGEESATVRSLTG